MNISKTLVLVSLSVLFLQACKTTADKSSDSEFETMRFKVLKAKRSIGIWHEDFAPIPNGYTGLWETRSKWHGDSSEIVEYKNGKKDGVAYMLNFQHNTFEISEYRNGERNGPQSSWRNGKKLLMWKSLRSRIDLHKKGYFFYFSSQNHLMLLKMRYAVINIPVQEIQADIEMRFHRKRPFSSVNFSCSEGFESAEVSFNNNNQTALELPIKNLSGAISSKILGGSYFEFLLSASSTWKCFPSIENLPNGLADQIQFPTGSRLPSDTLT